jgi:signal transduction histidine kinase/phage shock protein PspC (stress-responsive transcriptional regulator)
MRLLGGVCRGIAMNLGWSVEAVRLLFVGLTLLGGFGVMLYAAYWLWLPVEPRPGSAVDTSAEGRDVAGLVGVLALGAGVLLLLPTWGVPVSSSWVLPALLVAGGVAVIWRQSDESRRQELLADVEASARVSTQSALRRTFPRVLLGAALVLLGLVGVVASQGDLGAALRSLAAALLAVVGVAVVILPFVVGWWRDLVAERRARIRSEERAEVAAQVHDSVLQTLTLIQRSASDPEEVVRLARGEERALRRWLYAPVGDPTATFVAALEEQVADVETSYSATVELVHVGDVARDDRIDALIAATREALINAAKHAGGVVQVYVECTDADVEVFVRDRGPGFDVAAVPDDRLGLRESVVARMARVGGSVVVDSRPGEGTEVALSLPMTLGARARA